MGTLCDQGLLVPLDPELKKELTVRANINALGFAPPSFKLFRIESGQLIVPRYYGLSKFGPAAKDSRQSPHRADACFTGTLRTETCQDRAFEAGIKAFEEVGGGVLSLPCGYGKTCTALAFASHLKLRTIIIVHKEFLVDQWTEAINKFCPGATIGKIQQDVFDVEKDFVLAMIQTMCTRELPSLHTFGLVIVDEAHHIGAAAFSQSMFKLCPKYTLGLTATPERKDGLTQILYWFLGPQFFAVERKNQSKTKVEIVMFSDPLYKCAPSMNKFGKVNMADMVTQISELKSRNELILKLIQKNLKKDRKIIVLCDRREQCFYLKNQFPDKISGVYLGQMSDSDLSESSKKPLVIATFAMAAEGLDIPQLDTCILASPHSDVTQAVGRIMRETKGKKHSPLIYDIVDKWSMFYSMYKKRCTFYKKSGFEFENKLEEEKQKGLQECAFI